MFFSIVVPVYNSEKYLEECIESVLAQDFNDYELILVDDGSTDSSGNICDKYATIDSRINVIHQSNFGSYEARRTGFLSANGQYILALDSDDWFEQNAFSRIYSVLNEKNYDIVIFNFQRYSQDGRFEKNNTLLLDNKTYTRKDIMNEAIFYERINNLCNKAVRGSLYKIVCKDLSMEMINGEDLFVTLRVLNISSKFYYLNEVLYNYRCRENSSTMKIRNTYFKDMDVLYKEKLKFIDKNRNNIRRISTFTMNSVLRTLVLYAHQNYSLKVKKDIYKEILIKTYFVDSIKFLDDFSIIWYIEFLLLQKQKNYCLDKYLKLLYLLQQVKIFLINKLLKRK